MFQPYLGQQLLIDIRHFCDTISDIKFPKISQKPDSSLVTEIDIKISEFIKNHSAIAGYCFYSEEDHNELNFPAAIVDPLDGTREFVAGRAECAVSVAIMDSPNLATSFGIILNPFTGFSLTTNDKQLWQPNVLDRKPLGLISRSEWEAGIFKNINGDFDLIPRGSIAFKLALLASGAADFVVSLRPKNIWDIAAGTILCEQRGIQLWSRGKIVKSLVDIKLESPLIWCKPSLHASLHDSF